MTPESRAVTLARLQFTQEEIETMETGDPHTRALLAGEAQIRLTTFNAAMMGNPRALTLMSEIVQRRKHQDRVAQAKAKLARSGVLIDDQQPGPAIAPEGEEGDA